MSDGLREAIEEGKRNWTYSSNLKRDVEWIEESVREWLARVGVSSIPPTKETPTDE